MESVRDHRITLARSANGVGKTHSAAYIAFWFFLCFPGAKVFTAAAPPEENLKKILWGEINTLAEKHHNTLLQGMQINVTDITTSANSFITGVTIPSTGSDANREGRFSGKHGPHMLFILDEADAIPEYVFKGIESCMSGGDVHLLALYNPRNESGPVYQMERDGKAHSLKLTAFNHPNVLTGENQIPGAVDRKTTVRRIIEWSVPLPEDKIPNANCFEVPEFLVDCVASSAQGIEYPPLVAGHREVINQALWYMVLAQYPTQSEKALISKEWVNAARTRWDAYVAANGVNPPNEVQPILGLDVADMGTDLNALCIRYGGWVKEIKTWGGVNPVVTADRVATEYQAHDAYVVNVDAIGVGASVPENLRRNGCTAERIIVSESPTIKFEFGMFRHLRDQLWWLMREWLREDPGAMLPPDQGLIEELTIPTYKVKVGYIEVLSKEKMIKALGRSPDKAESLLMTFAEHKPLMAW